MRRHGYARTKKKGIEARLVWAQFFSPRAGTLQVMEKIDGSKWFPNLDATGPLPERTQGGYAELGYNVLYPLKKTQHELVGFVRAETYDTQAKVPKGFSRVREFSVQELTMGLSYRPLRTLVFKFDVQLRDRQWGNDTLLINGGIGFMM